jgi:hypothetical protein
MSLFFIYDNGSEMEAMEWHLENPITDEMIVFPCNRIQASDAELTYLFKEIPELNHPTRNKSFTFFVDDDVRLILLHFLRLNRHFSYWEAAKGNI